jgi:hypothetical protein
MAIQDKSYQNTDKAKVDEVEQDLVAKRFAKVSPLIKKKPYQYSRSQAPANPESFEGPLTYTIEWCIDE